jgi:hypothetical protein
MQGIRGSAQETPAKQHRPPAPLQAQRPLTQFDRYFSFRAGQARSYIVHGESGVGSGQNVHLEPIQGSYTETVLSVRTIAPSIRIVEVKIVGSGPYHTDCINDAADKKRPAWILWYVAHDNRVFEVCTREGVDALERNLQSSPSGLNSVDGPEYVLPFQVGATWGADPDTPKREDTFYEWSVEERRKAKVPAGKYEGCFQMIYRTIPDHLLRTVCPGVGLVAEEYTHHGWTNHYRIELAKVTSPENASK